MEKAFLSFFSFSIGQAWSEFFFLAPVNIWTWKVLLDARQNLVLAEVHKLGSIFLLFLFFVLIWISFFLFSFSYLFPPFSRSLYSLFFLILFSFLKKQQKISTSLEGFLTRPPEWSCSFHLQKVFFFGHS